MHRFSLITLTLFSVGLAGGALTGCGSDNNNNSGGPDSGMGTTRTLTFQLDGVPDLGNDYVYEGWLVDSSGAHSSGRFSVDQSGNTVPASFTVDAALADGATKITLTIEPAVGDDPAPAKTHFLAGALSGGTADMTVNAALGVDLSTATGSYILATPSTGNNTDDNNQGIWWLKPGQNPAPALDLPTLPSGWMYEGWVVGGDGPVTTGKFTSVSGADKDGTGPTAGPDAGPPFPGQDFIDPAMVLDTSYAAVITVEPDPDNSPMPFAIKPLIDSSIDAVAAPASQDMTVGPAAPSATATIQ